MSRIRLNDPLHFDHHILSPDLWCFLSDSSSHSGKKMYALLQSLVSPASQKFYSWCRGSHQVMSQCSSFILFMSLYGNKTLEPSQTYSHTDIFVLMNTLFPGCSPHSVLWHWLMCQHGCAVSGSDRFSRFHLSATCKTINPMPCSPTHLMPCPVLAYEFSCENLGNSSTSIESSVLSLTKRIWKNLESPFGCTLFKFFLIAHQKS